MGRRDLGEMGRKIRQEVRGDGGGGGNRGRGGEREEKQEVSWGREMRRKIGGGKLGGEKLAGKFEEMRGGNRGRVRGERENRKGRGSWMENLVLPRMVYVSGY